MTLPPLEICHHILALHVLLFDGKDDRRIELLHLLAAHGMMWNSLPEFFAVMKVSTATPLPVPGSRNSDKICQLHAAMGSTDKDGSVAHQKLIDQLAKRQFSWPVDLATILAAHWTFRNPPLSSSTASSTGAPEVDVFALTKAVIEDRAVLAAAALVVSTLITLCSHVCEQFAKLPQFGIVAPTPGFGKSTLLKVLQRLVARPWATKHATAPAIYRHLRRQPRSTLLLDALENQNLTVDSVLCTILDACHEGGNKALVENKESITIEIHVLVI